MVREKDEAGRRLRGYWEENAKMKRGATAEGRYDEEHREKIERMVEEMWAKKEQGPRWCEDGFEMEDVERVWDWLEGKGKKSWRSKEGKASGEDGVYNWMLTKGGEEMQRAVLEIGNLVWEWESVVESGL